MLLIPSHVQQVDRAFCEVLSCVAAEHCSADYLIDEVVGRIPVAPVCVLYRWHVHRPRKHRLPDCIHREKSTPRYPLRVRVFRVTQLLQRLASCDHPPPTDHQPQGRPIWLMRLLGDAKFSLIDTALGRVSARKRPFLPALARNREPTWTAIYATDGLDLSHRSGC